jgi:hypothetical protein
MAPDRHRDRYGRKLTPIEKVGYPTRIVSVTLSLKW